MRTKIPIVLSLVAFLAFAQAASVRFTIQVHDTKTPEAHRGAPNVVLHEWDRLTVQASAVPDPRYKEKIYSWTWRIYATLSSGFGIKPLAFGRVNRNYTTHRWPPRGSYVGAMISLGPFYSRYDYAKLVGNPRSTKTEWWEIDDRKGTYRVVASVLVRKQTGTRKVCIPIPSSPPVWFCYSVPVYKYYRAAGSTRILVAPPEYGKRFDPDLWGAVAQTLQFMRHRIHASGATGYKPAGSYMLARSPAEAYLRRINQTIHSYYKECSGFLCIAEAVPGYNLTALFLQTSRSVSPTLRQIAKSYCGVAAFGRGDLLCLSFGNHGGKGWLSPYKAEADVLVLRGPKHSWLLVGDLTPGGRVDIFRLTEPRHAETVIRQIFFPTKDLKQYADSFTRLGKARIDYTRLAEESSLARAYPHRYPAGSSAGAAGRELSSYAQSRIRGAVKSATIEIDLYNERAREEDLGKVPGYVPVTPAP